MNTDRILISVVIPCYRCRECLPELHARLTAALTKITAQYEIILVDDASPEGDWEEIAAIARQDSRVKGIKLSRNFGQHFAITAGLDFVRGDWIVVMDGDLQDQPEEILKLHAKAQEGYDIVFARRTLRQDSLYRRLSSGFFSLIYNYLGDIKVDNSIANFSISSRAVIAYVRQFRERNRAFPIFLNSVGFRRAGVEVNHAERFAGRSSYTFGKLLDFAIQCIVSQSNKPLRISIRFGFALAALSVFYGLVILFRYFFYSITVPGWTTLAVLVCFLGGLGFANLGILGLYIGKIFDEVKQRPLYCVEQTKNIESPPGNRGF